METKLQHQLGLATLFYIFWNWKLSIIFKTNIHLLHTYAMYRTTTKSKTTKGKIKNYELCIATCIINNMHVYTRCLMLRAFINCKIF